MTMNRGVLRRSRRALLTICAIAAALLLVDVVRWLAESQTEILRSDFSGIYMGGLIWRTRGHGVVYDVALQQQVYAHLTAPDHTGLLPFPQAPFTAVLAAPLTLLSLTAAFRIASMAQFLLVLLGVGLTAHAAPWRGPQARLLATTSALTGAAVLGTFQLILEGQTDGILVLGLGACYWLIRHDRPMLAGLVLAVAAGTAKPDLAVGLALFLLGRRQWRLILGAALGTALTVLGSWLAVGGAGIAGFVWLALHEGAVPAASPTVMSSPEGMLISWFGSSTFTWSVAIALNAAAALAALACGHLSRRRRGSVLEATLAAATLLSLLASPHLLSHDMVLTGPAFVLLLSSAGQARPATVWPDRPEQLVLFMWVVVTLATAFDIAGLRGLHLVPLALAATVVVALRLAGPTAVADPTATQRMAPHSS